MQTAYEEGPGKDGYATKVHLHVPLLWEIPDPQERRAWADSRNDCTDQDCGICAGCVKGPDPHETDGDCRCLERVRNRRVEGNDEASQSGTNNRDHSSNDKGRGPGKRRSREDNEDVRRRGNKKDRAGKGGMVPDPRYDENRRGTETSDDRGGREYAHFEPKDPGMSGEDIRTGTSGA